LIRAGEQFNAKDSLTKIGAGRTILEYRTRQNVFSQGYTADAVFYIQKGTVKVTVCSEQGTRAAHSIFGRDEFFGEGCLAQQLRDT
jgi:CRP-like cAMP-binding protein